MYTSGNLSQRSVCMVVSAFIVTACLSLGVFAADHAAHVGYSVTITQLQ